MGFETPNLLFGILWIYFFLNFLSGNCKKLLDSGNITEHDGEMFCNSCYRKFFGPKGYGFGGGAGTLSMDDGNGYKVKFLHFSTKVKKIILLIILKTYYIPTFINFVFFITCIKNVCSVVFAIFMIYFFLSKDNLGVKMIMFSSFKIWYFLMSSKL